MYWIIGNRGMLGAELSRLFDALGVAYVGTDREVDITKPEELARFGDAQAGAVAQAGAGKTPAFDWVINCAAYTAVDQAEADSELCRKLNAEGPANVAAYAEHAGAKVLHLSTDYVFNGRSVAPYREDDPPDPIGVYGKTKRAGEAAVLSRQGYVVRTSWLYGQYGNNFVKTMLRLMNERDTVSVVNDQRGNPTWARDLAQAICRLTGGAVPPGIYHYTNTGGITWYDFAAEIYRLGRELGGIRKACAVRPCATADYPTRAVRPTYSVLATAKIQAALGIGIPDWKLSLKSYLTETVYPPQ